MKVTYIGYSSEIIEYLFSRNDIEIEYVITKIGMINHEIINMMKKENIEIKYVEKRQDLYDIPEKYYKNVVLIYKFGIIIPDDIIKKGSFFNIHFGDLRTNRGAHSLRWSILLRDTETKMSIYKIDGVDEGLVISENDVFIDDLDNIITLEKKMEDKFRELIDALFKFQMGRISGYEVKNGKYRRKIVESDYMISSQDSLETASAKIRAMFDFGGAICIYNGVKYRVKDCVVGINSIICNDEQEVILFQLQHQKVFLLVEKYAWI